MTCFDCGDLIVLVFVGVAEMEMVFICGMKSAWF